MKHLLRAAVGHIAIILVIDAFVRIVCGVMFTHEHGDQEGVPQLMSGPAMTWDLLIMPAGILMLTLSSFLLKQGKH